MKVETRIIPQEIPPKFFAQHLKPYEFVKNFIQGKKVLEIGCGDGYGTAYLSRFAQEAVGIDYAEDVVLTAEKKYKAANLSYESMDATNLEFKDSSFDVICSFQVIEHIPENFIQKYLLEIKRVLKEDGQLFLTTLNVKHCMKNSPETYKKNEAHCKEFTSAELHDLISRNFTIKNFLGLHQTAKHNFFNRLKKIGICRYLPISINPVERYYKNVTTEDFVFKNNKIETASDFLVVARNK